MLAELSHERLLEPRGLGDGDPRFELVGDDPGVRYEFAAARWLLDHWEVEPDSITRVHDGEPTPLDCQQFVLDFRERLGLPADALSGYLEELSACLFADAYKDGRQRFDADALARGSFQDVETSMTAGHPCFVVNAGRLGFDVDDYRRHAPEAATTMRMMWLAASSRHAAFHSVASLDYEGLLREELGLDTRARFDAAIRAQGRPGARYVLIPVHPWQWRNRLCFLFAGDIARRDLVVLGEGDDHYQPQQSIRTAYNLSHPRRHYVKTALSIVNMGFVRGLSPYYMEGTPAINEWVDELVREDPTLRRLGFGILREVATVGYRSPTFERAGPRSSPHNKMLAALWRESPRTRIEDGEQLVTMAALLHRDQGGASMLGALVRRSGRSGADWLRRYLRAYLVPLVHCYYVHSLVFMPHGENTILVLRDGLPVRVFMKDIAEEIAVFEGAERLPPEVRRVGIHIPPALRNQAFFMDVFDCFFRFLAPIAARDAGVPQAEFWRLVAEAIWAYLDEHPASQAAFERDSLFVPRFELSCSNRLQLRCRRQLLDLSDPSSSLQFAGPIDNPLAPFARAARSLQEVPLHAPHPEPSPDFARRES